MTLAIVFSDWDRSISTISTWATSKTSARDLTQAWKEHGLHAVEEDSERNPAHTEEALGRYAVGDPYDSKPGENGGEHGESDSKYSEGATRSIVHLQLFLLGRMLLLCEAIHCYGQDSAEVHPKRKEEATAVGPLHLGALLRSEAPGLRASQDSLAPTYTAS